MEISSDNSHWKWAILLYFPWQSDSIRHEASRYMSTNARSLSYIIVYSVHFICALSIQISKVCQDIYMLPSYCWQNTAKVPFFNFKEFQNIVFQQNSSLQQLPCSSPFWRFDQSISSISFRGVLDPPQPRACFKSLICRSYFLAEVVGVVFGSLEAWEG